MARLILNLAVVLHVAVNAVAPQREPFGIATVAVGDGPLVETWSSVRQQLRRDQELILRCAERTVDDCATATNLVRIVDDARQWSGKARIGHINRAINLSIKPSTGGWESGLDALRLARGDCKAYALAKYLALLEAGIPQDSLRLVIVRNQGRDREDHIVVTVNLDDHWLILDDAMMVLRKDVEAPEYTPLFVLDQTSVRRYVAHST